MSIDVNTIGKDDLGRAITAKIGPGYAPKYVAGTVHSVAKATVLIRTVEGKYVRAHKSRVLGLYPGEGVAYAVSLRDAMTRVHDVYKAKIDGAQRDMVEDQQYRLRQYGGDRRS